MVSEVEMVPRRHMRTVAEKRRIVEETLVCGASAAAIARKYDVNANLLFGWRRLYKQGLLEGSREPAAKLLPVEVTTPTVVARRSATTEVSKARSRGTTADAAAPSNHLEIEWPSGVRVRLHGPVDADVLGTVLSALAQQNR
jgi:transposase